MYYAWVASSPAAKLLLVVIGGIVLTAIMRFARLAFRLHPWMKRRTLVPEDMAKGRAAPNLIAAFALGSWSLCDKVLPKCIDAGVPADPSGKDRVIAMLRMSESRFVYLWESCSADVESGKRASLLLLLLSVPLVGFNIFSTYLWFCEGRHVSAYWCLFEMVHHQVSLFAFGVWLSAMVYFMSSVFERLLSKRKASWNYFCSRLNDGNGNSGQAE